jgi:hypothetical protein
MVHRDFGTHNLRDHGDDIACWDSRRTEVGGDVRRAEIGGWTPWSAKMLGS